MRASIAALACALTMVVVAIAVGPACSIDSRSDDFRCTNPGQCGAGRDCVDGWCVVDPGEVDASTECPMVCTSCMNGTCIIDCGEPGACPDKVVCPSMLPCTVRCSGAGSCSAGVECGAKACDVTCSGDGSCNDGIDCNRSCACRTSCPGVGACSGRIDCPGNCVQGGQCTTSPPGQCDNC